MFKHIPWNLSRYNLINSLSFSFKIQSASKTGTKSCQIIQCSTNVEAFISLNTWLGFFVMSINPDSKIATLKTGELFPRWALKPSQESIKGFPKDSKAFTF